MNPFLDISYMNFISSAIETVCSFLPAKGKEIQDNVLFHNIFQMPASMSL